MGAKRSIRKIVELGIGAIAIGTLILAGCGGGGGVLAGPGGDVISVVALLGQFSQGATIRVKDNTGKLLITGTVDANGVAKVTVPSNAPTPLLIEAGINGDTYFDEHTGTLQTISGVATGAIRAFVPATTVSQVGVTALTEIAAGGLVDASGTPQTGITPASAIGANAAVGQMFGVADPTLPPTIVASVSAVAALGSSTAADQYALKLAALSRMAAASGVTAQVGAQQLSAGLNLNPVNLAPPTISVASIATSMQASLNALANTNAAQIASAMNIPASNATLNALAQGAALVAHNALTSNPTANLSTIIAQAQLSASSVEAAIASGTSPASAVANIGAGLTAVNDLIATGTSAAGLQSYQGYQAALAGAGSGVPVGGVTKLTAGSTTGSYTATDVTYAYNYANSTWAADTTGKYSNYVLTASGWKLDDHGGTAVNNNDGTITLTDKHGTYTVTVLETKLDGVQLYGSSVTAPTYFPANSLFFFGNGGVSSQDLYELWTNGGVTDMNGNPLTALPAIGTAFCANGFVLTATPTPPAGSNYNLMGSLFGMGGCTQSNIASVTGASSIPIAGTTVSVQTKATGISSTNVMLITSNMPYLNNCILGVVGSAVQIGCPIEFNMGSGRGGFTPKGTAISSSIESHNKTAMDAELSANGLPPLP